MTPSGPRLQNSSDDLHGSLAPSRAHVSLGHFPPKGVEIQLKRNRNLSKFSKSIHLICGIVFLVTRHRSVKDEGPRCRRQQFQWESYIQDIRYALTLLSEIRIETDAQNAGALHSPAVHTA